MLSISCPLPSGASPILCYYSFIHSFIHFEHFYSAPSWRLLRSAPDSSTAEQESFYMSVKGVRDNPREQSERQRYPIPEREANPFFYYLVGANNREGAIVAVWANGTRRKPCLIFSFYSLSNSNSLSALLSVCMSVCFSVCLSVCVSL